MKKLLVTAIGAAAAFGAVAGTISTQRFENVTGELPQTQTISDLNTLAGGNYWSGDEITNTYTVVSISGEAFPQGKPLGTPTKALAVKTTFGSPLKVNANVGGSSTNIPASGIYFDSLVKFTVCEDAPDQTYPDAKIIMWLQEQSSGDTITGTNIMFRANNINADGTFTPTTFTCYSFTGNIDNWYRVTIKTWADITKNGSGVPGFAIFINGTAVNVATGATMADAYVGNLTEAAGYLGSDTVFASLVQGNAAGKSTITSASFDGTGALTDLVFTDEAPFSAAEDYVAPKAIITVNDTPYGSETGEYTDLADAITALNAITAGAANKAEVKFALQKGLEFAGPLTIENSDPKVTIVIDLNGFAITNTAAEFALVCNSPVTITDSSEAKTGAIVSDDAIYVGESSLVELVAGTIDGYIDIETEDDASAILYGGTVKQDNESMLAEGMKFVNSSKGAGYYDVVTDPAYGAVAKIGDDYYQTLKDAVDAADTGDTVTILRDCSVTNGNVGITFTNGINLVNNYTITIDGANYALRIANGTTTPVTLSGTGSIVWANGSGSPILVGNNEAKASYGISTFYKGSFVLNGGTLTSTDKTAKGGNLVKLEDGTFVMNAGTINGGTRGVKADSENNNATCVLTINGGTIVNTNTAAIAASTDAGGSSTVTVNAGTFSGKIDGAGMVTIPGTSTAQFDRDQTAFCEAGYRTVQSGGWYVVTAMEYYTAISLNTNALSIVTNTTATLTATTTPASAADDSVTWTSSNTSVATVDQNGVVTAVGAGEATITAATANYSATCTVTVTAPAPTPETPTIPAGQSSVEVAGTGEEDAATVAAGVRVANATSVPDETYQGYFAKTATYSSETGKWTVTAEFTDTVKGNATTSAAAIVSGTAASGNVTVPAGVYYKITTYTALGGTAVQSLDGQSNGTDISVNKPGTTQGFIKVEMATVPFD